MFRVGDGYRVIDWQRVKIGPRDLDLSSLLGSLGLNVEDHIDASIRSLQQFLPIWWLTQCKKTWIPDGGYGPSIVKLAGRLERTLE